MLFVPFHAFWRAMPLRSLAPDSSKMLKLRIRLVVLNLRFVTMGRMFRPGDALKIRRIVVEMVFISVVDLAPIWNFSVVELPDVPMKEAPRSTEVSR